MSAAARVVAEKVHVYVRARPRVSEDAVEDDPAEEGGRTFVTPGTETESDESLLVFGDDGTCTYHRDENSKRYAYTGCLGEYTSQDEVFETCAKRVVGAVGDGFNGTIIAYGQTGSGKTHTMRGGEDLERGVVARAFTHLEQAAAASQQAGVETSMSMSYVQIYNEVLTDLLNDEHADLSIRERPAHDGGGVFVEGLSRVPVASSEAALLLLDAGDGRRFTAATQHNANSSRSHACALIHVERKTVATGQVQTRSTLTLVDLAGSERLAATRNLPQRQNECKAINLSLSALGNCVAALAAKRPHVPFRDSKLTRLLQASLGGDARTTIIATVRTYGGDSLGETKQTLEFASRAAQVSVRALAREVAVDYAKLYAEAQKVLDLEESKSRTCELKCAQACEDAANTRRACNDAEAEAEALRRRLESAESRHSQALIALRASTNGEDDGTAADAIEELHARWAADADSAEKRHKNDLATACLKADEKVAAYRAAANSSSGECDHAEEELTSERTQHLETLALLRKVKAEKSDSEAAGAARISELLDECTTLRASEDKLKADVDASKMEKQRQRREFCERVSVLEDATERERAKIVGDYVSRESVKEMENLFSTTIDALMDRLSSLEGKQNESQNRHVAAGGARQAMSQGARAVLDDADRRRLPSLGDARQRRAGAQFGGGLGRAPLQPQAKWAQKSTRGAAVDPRTVFY
ncbi:P-loop containing nucleoside triphosphate hydrolase protein [Pelagophyceae sp. CCMP2097]|nr:P-loop containing nucleoside triphosphate hydrolase protein [Pelagophyceae sp. CCMP2097]|mmetsp:Transcript_7217/g.25251  ORF Transcript_7217/g.25251 Transcript_7217/m.25251 type:complete len:706 (+) Transcript_7217:74-2191(+)